MHRGGNKGKFKSKGRDAGQRVFVRRSDYTVIPKKTFGVTHNKSIENSVVKF